MRPLIRTAFVAAFGFASVAAAQPSEVLVRELGTPLGSAPQRFGSLLGIHQFADGKVLVNDGGSRRIVLLNRDLTLAAVVLDSVAGAANYYGPRASPIIRYSGDSVLFVDGSSTTLLLIPPEAKLLRSISLPKPTDVRWLASSASGIDASSRLVYMGGPSRQRGSKPDSPVTRRELLLRDSIPIVRADFESRKIDTVVYLPFGADRRVDDRSVNGQPIITIFHTPLFYTDEWTVTSDGAIAIVRAEQYAVEFIDSSGHRSKPKKIPFDWQPFTEKEKGLYLDSARTAFEKLLADQAPVSNNQFMTQRGVVAALSAPPGSRAAILAATTHVWISPEELPDFWPPMRTGAVKADCDGNIWILPTRSSAAREGQISYDVVNPNGELVYRVRMPTDRSIAGFGRDGSIFVMFKTVSGAWGLEERKLR